MSEATVRIESRDGNNATYFVIHPDGSDEQVNRDISAELVEAEEKGERIEDVVARSHLAKAEVTRVVEGVRVIRVKDSTPHDHDERYLKMLPEHDHKRAEETERLALEEIGKLTNHIARVQEHLREHRHGMEPHDHDGRYLTSLPTHEHPHVHDDLLKAQTEMQELVAGLSSSVAGISKAHSHDQILSALRVAEAAIESLYADFKAHGHPHEHTDLMAKIREERDERISDRAHGHPVTEHEHPHGHADIVAMVGSLEEKIKDLGKSIASATHRHEDIDTSLEGLQKEIKRVEAKATTHEHPHNHNDLNDRISGVAEDLSRHAHSDKADREHPHHDIQADINLLNTRMHRQEEHVHEDKPHSHAEFTTLQDEIAALRLEMVALRSEIRDHGHALPEHDHDIKPHTHDELATKTEFAAHLDDVKKKTAFVQLSSEETSGKRRVVMQEAD